LHHTNFIGKPTAMSVVAQITPHTLGLYIGCRPASLRASRPVRRAVPLAALRPLDVTPVPSASPSLVEPEADILECEFMEPSTAEQHQLMRHEAQRPSSPLTQGLRLLSVGAIAGGGLMGSGFDLRGPESVIEALGVLAAAVFIHELGHFSAARLQGIHVSKFSIGFGPALIKQKVGEVEYTLCALPLGGYVAFPDDDPDSPYPPEDPNLLRNRPLLDRVLVVTAGVVFNAILAMGICTTQASTVGIVEPVYSPGVKLGTVMAGTAAEKAGLRQGDLVLQVGDLLVAPSPKCVDQVVDKIRDNPNRTLTFRLMRDGQEEAFPVRVAEVPDGTGRIGVQMAANATVERRRADGPVQALSLGASEFRQLFGSVTGGLWRLVTRFSTAAEQLSGPVAIVAMGAEVARADAGRLLQFGALININLAVVNILPLPALDGGFLVFLALEAVRGKKIDAEVEKGVMGLGFLLLSSVGIFLILRDIVNLSGIAG
jgi:membrane-associated protease RseP (regulator of RpoE activity)